MTARGAGAKPVICNCCGWYGLPDALDCSLYEDELGDGRYVEVCPRCGTRELESGSVFEDLETYGDESYEEWKRLNAI